MYNTGLIKYVYTFGFGVGNLSDACTCIIEDKRGPCDLLHLTPNIGCPLPSNQLSNHLYTLTSGTIVHMTICSSGPIRTSICVELSVTLVHHANHLLNTGMTLYVIIPSGEEVPIYTICRHSNNINTSHQ